LADLQRSPGVQHHHALRGDHEQDIGHHPFVLGGGETVFGVNHPDVF
jgi:hypothetical protein